MDYSDKLIGIICPNNKVMDKYLEQLQSQQRQEARFNEVVISYYRHGKEMEINFTQGESL